MDEKADLNDLLQVRERLQCAVQLFTKANYTPVQLVGLLRGFRNEMVVSYFLARCPLRMRLGRISARCVFGRSPR